MNIIQLEPISRLAADLKLNLARDQENALATVCAAIDRYVTRGSTLSNGYGCAEVFKSGVRERVFAAAHVNAVVRGVTDASEVLDDFLRIAERIPHMPRLLRDAIRAHPNGAIDGDIFDRYRLSSVQRDYANRLVRSLTTALSLPVVRIDDINSFGSPALFTLASVIARRRVNRFASSQYAQGVATCQRGNAADGSLLGKAVAARLGDNSATQRTQLSSADPLTNFTPL